MKLSYYWLACWLLLSACYEATPPRFSPEELQQHHQAIALKLYQRGLDGQANAIGAQYVQRYFYDQYKADLSLLYQKANLLCLYNSDFNRCIACCQEVLRLDTSYFPAYYLLGRLKVKHGQYQEAVPHLQKAVGIDSITAQVHALLAESYYRLGDYEQAQQQAESAVALDSNDVVSWNHLGLLATAKKQHKRALTFHQKAWTKDADAHQTYKAGVLLAYNYTLLGAPQRAEVYLQKIKDRSSMADCDNYQYLSAVYELRKDPEKAWFWWQKWGGYCTRSTEQRQKYWKKAVTIHLKQHNYDLALSISQHALANRVDSAYYNFVQAKIFAQDSLWEKACQAAVEAELQAKTPALQKEILTWRASACQ